MGQVDPPEWLFLNTVLERFGRRNARRRYHAFVMEGVDEETREFYQRKKAGAVMGKGSFLDELPGELDLSKKAVHPEIPAIKHLREPLPMDRIIAVTASAFGVNKEELLAPRRGRGTGNLPRSVAMSLCRSPGGFPIKDIARAFGVGHYSSVSVAAARLRRKSADDPKLAATVTAIRKKLKKES
jgi:hypothetical protein